MLWFNYGVPRSNVNTILSYKLKIRQITKLKPDPSPLLADRDVYNNIAVDNKSIISF